MRHRRLGSPFKFKVGVSRLTVCLRRPRRSPLQPTFAIVKASNYPPLLGQYAPRRCRARAGGDATGRVGVSDRIIERGKKPFVRSPLPRSLDVDDRGKIRRAANNDPPPPPPPPPQPPSWPTAPSLGASRRTRFSASGGPLCMYYGSALCSMYGSTIPNRVKHKLLHHIAVIAWVTD